MLPEDEHGRIRSLASMARAVGPSRTLPRLLEMAAEEALGALFAASVSVSQLQPGSQVVRTLVNVGELGPTEERWPLDETYLIREFCSLDPGVDHVVSWTADVDDPATPDEEVALLTRLGKGSSVSAAMVVDGQLWGEFYATRRRGDPGFDTDDIAYLEALLAILAGAISRFTREESLTALAFHDPLTGLLNRRALDDAATAAFAVPPGGQREVVVVAVDIDGLKQVNDSEGHDAGDRLIRSAADLLAGAFGVVPGSLVARVGGDEFTVLVTDRPLAEVVAAADSVCRTGGEESRIELSCGAAGAVLTAGATLTSSELFAAADRALYVAKRERSIRTVVGGALAPTPPV